MNVWLIAIAVSLLLTLIRFIVGPTFFDRIVAFDTMTTVTISLFVLFALIFNKTYLMDVALVYAILAFVGVVAVIRYFEREV